MNASFEDFQKLRIKIGLIVEAEKVEGADKLLKLKVDFGDEKRQIISGIAQFYKPENLIGKETTFVINLEPRIIRGVESHGMLMAADVDGKPILLKPIKKIPPGSPVK